MKTFFKKQTLVLLVLILSGTVKATAQQATPVGYYGMMQAEGNRIVGSKTGEPMQVKGASFFWSNWSGQFWTEAVVDDMVDNWNVELLRAAWGVQDNGTPYSTDHSQLYTVVDRCIERGIYVIIDWHTHGLDLNVQAAKDFWNKVFDERPQYINNDAVIFELFNEPRFESDGGPDWTTCKSVQEDVLSVIRGRGANNHVIIGTPNFSQDVDAASANPIDDSNVSYALHFYVPNHCAPIWNKIPTAMNNGVPLFATEWGFWDLASWSQCGSDDKAGFAREWMNRLDDNMISWASWGISDKVPEQSSLYWDGSFASSWLPTELQNWRETPVPWICEDFEVSSLEIDGQTTLYPGQETELKAYGITTCNRLLQDATWSSNASGGFFSSDTPGEYTVTASAEGFSAEITITVEEINGTIIGDNEVDDAGEPVTQMCTPWYVHLGNDGTAEFNRTQPGVLGTSYAGKLDYSVVLGANDWDNQAGLGINMTSDETGFDISGSTGIAFWYKGPSVELQVGIETMMNNEN
jgi:aryl-phospho-beta-D-glucosidase BglC (GH1 family)